MVVILLFWSTAYLVNFSSRLLTIISNSLILSSFSVMALGDLPRKHMQLFWERFKTSNPTLLLRQRSKVWIWWANVTEPDNQFYLFAILFHKGNFWRTICVNHTNRMQACSINTLLPRRELDNAALQSVTPRSNSLNFLAPKLQIMYLQIIPDVAFVVHIQLVILKWCIICWCKDRCNFAWFHIVTNSKHIMHC